MLAPLLDISVATSGAPEVPPDELRRRQLAAMTAWVLAGARTQPLVLAFEDLHWADPTSLDLLRMLAERGTKAPLMVIATARPEFRAPWVTRSHHGIISLVPLDRQQVSQMVGSIAERNAFSADALEGVAVRTGGVPLFVEEVTRLMLDGERKRYRRPCSNRLPRGSTDLAKPAKLRRWARSWDANSSSASCARLRGCRRLNSMPRSRSLSTPISCLSTAVRPIQPTASSTR